MNIIISRMILPLTFISILTGCDSKEVKMVKDGSISACPNTTVEKMVTGFFGSPKWKTVDAGNGKKYVNATGNMKYMEKEVKGAIQFDVNAETGRFQLLAFEINEVPQNQLMQMGLLQKMCESVK